MKKKKRKEIFNFQIDLRISIRLYVQKKKKIPSRQDIAEIDRVAGQFSKVARRDVTKHRSRARVKDWTSRLADNRNPRERVPTTFDPLAARSTSGFSFLRLLLEDVGTNERSIESVAMVAWQGRWRGSWISRLKKTR